MSQVISYLTANGTCTDEVVDTSFGRKTSSIVTKVQRSLRVRAMAHRHLGVHCMDSRTIQTFILCGMETILVERT